MKFPDDINYNSNRFDSQPPEGGNNRLDQYFRRMRLDRLARIDDRVEQIAKHVVACARRKKMNDIQIARAMQYITRDAYDLIKGKIHPSECEEITLQMVDLAGEAVKADYENPMPYVSGRMYTFLARAIEKGRCRR